MAIKYIKMSVPSDCCCISSLTASRSNSSDKMASSRSFVLAIVLVLCSQVLTARLRRDAETPTQDLVEGLRTQLQTVGSEVNKALGLPEGGATVEELRTVFQNKAKEVEERAKGFIEEANRQLEARRGEMSESAAAALAQAQQHVNASLEQLKTTAQSAPSTLETVHQNIARTMETLAEENSKLARAAGDDVGAAHDQLATLSRNTLNQAMDLMRNFATEIQTHANKASES